MSVRTIPWEEVEAELLQDPEVRRLVEEQEYLTELIILRYRRNMTQEELAAKVGTTPAVIARLENGNWQPSLAFLRRVAKALDARVIVGIRPLEEAETASHPQPAPDAVPAA